MHGENCVTWKAEKAKIAKKPLGRTAAIVSDVYTDAHIYIYIYRHAYICIYSQRYINRYMFLEVFNSPPIIHSLI